MAEGTVFDKVISKAIPADIVYEDELCLAFRDIHPVARVHVLLIPKKKDGLDRLVHAEERHREVLGHMMLKVGHIARLEGLAEDGYRLVVNDGNQAGQSVPHLHLHIIGGQQLFWPPGTLAPKAF